MNKEITFNGYTTVPSDYQCPDGDLSAAVNLIPEEGATRPVMHPKTVMHLPGHLRILYLHKTASYTHYVLFDTTASKLCWTADGSSFTPIHPVNGSPYQVEGVGNTLITLCPEGMHYALWKADRQAYAYLGTSLPELPLSFGLQGEMRRGDEFEIGLGGEYDNSPAGFQLTEGAQDWVTSQVLGKVNKFIADNSTNTARFIYPFFVRYAYRLYDGTLTRHSAPVLMVCSSNLTPQVFVTTLKGKDGKITDAVLRIAAMCHRLDYAVAQKESLDKLKEWEDLIASVDIFVSKPIYTYDQNGKCESIRPTGQKDTFTICLHTNQRADTATYPLRYQHHTFPKLYAFTFNPDTLQYPAFSLMLPRRTDRQVKEDIKSCNLFYLLTSIKPDVLSTERTALDVEDDYLQSLVNREAMTDDYDSHDNLIPQYAFTYNSRLNVANIRKSIFGGFPAQALLPYSNGYVAQFTDGLPTEFDRPFHVRCHIFIKRDGRDIIVSGDYGTIGFRTPVLFIYHPDTNAWKAVIEIVDSPSFAFYEVRLEKHNFLNGSFYFGSWQGAGIEANKTPSVPVPSTNEERTIQLPNKIYTSEVNNPFFFPLSGINTVGTGEVTGICAAVKALSQGQFGQFPLYAFTTEGVWALEVSATGTYTARQPVTRDVCANPGSITQTDTAVLFATARGIMLLQGSESTCISDVLSGTGVVPPSPETLPHYGTLLSLAGLDPSGGIPPSFADFLGGCRMLYDYLHRRIIAYNPDVRTAYVFSLKSRQWGMMVSDIAHGINSYPEALAVTADGVLVDFSQDGGGGEFVTRGLLVTRPIKLGMPDAHKTVCGVIQRGVFRRGAVRGILYASNDLFHWFTVWTSDDHYLRGFGGTPYKYFRLALVTGLRPDECLHAASFDYRPRLTNRMR